MLKQPAARKASQDGKHVPGVVSSRLFALLFLMLLVRQLNCRVNEPALIDQFLLDLFQRLAFGFGQEPQRK